MPGAFTRAILRAVTALLLSVWAASVCLAVPGPSAAVRAAAADPEGVFDGAARRPPETPFVSAGSSFLNKSEAPAGPPAAAPPEPPAPGREGDLDLPWLEAQARGLFTRNRVTVARSFPGKAPRVCTYHAPSLKWNINPDDYYPHQWLWDSCAHAITLSYLDPPAAEEEIRSLLYAQREDGFLPHMIWDRRHMRPLDPLHARLYPSRDHSEFTQPPLVAEAVERIYAETGDREFVRETFPALERFYGWLGRAREGVRGGPADGLAEIIGSDESGMDNAPDYDKLYRGPFGLTLPMNLLKVRYRLLGWDPEKIFASDIFRVKDVLFNTIYAVNLRSMASLAEAIGEPGKASAYREHAGRTEESLLGKCWDEETQAYYGLDARKGADSRLTGRATLSTLMPLALDDIPEDRVETLVRKWLVDKDRFWAEFPFPAEPRESYRHGKGGHGIWRGSQTWIFPVRYVVRGLVKQAGRFPEHAAEYGAIAQELTCRTYELVRRGGFREYYDAETGKGEGAKDFGWTALVVDMAHATGETRCAP